MIDFTNSEDIQALVDAIPTPVFVKDRDDRLVLVNSSACAFLGTDRARLLDADPGDHGAALLPLHADAQRALGDSEDVEHQERVRNAAGEMRNIVTRMRLMRTADAQEFIVGVASDVTDHLENEEHHRWSQNVNSQVMWSARPDGFIDEIGGKWTEMTGDTGEGATGHGWIEWVHPEDRARVLDFWNRTITDGCPASADFRVLSPQDTYLWFRSHCHPRHDETGRVIRWYGSLENIHERKLAEDRLRQSEERFRLAARASGLGIWDFDAVTGTRTWSEELREIVGIPPDAPADPALIRNLLRPEDTDTFDGLLAAAAERDAAEDFALTLRFTRMGEEDERWATANGWKITDSEGRLSRILFTVRDITDLRQADEQLRQAALHDALTGLPNRDLFNERLASAIDDGREAGRHVGLLMIDLDYLKQVNDAHGHDVGDAVLTMFARRLRRAAREGDTVARLGGDEFAVVMPSLTGIGDIAALGQRIIATAATPYRHRDLVIECKPSIGASCFPSHGTDPEELLKSADVALYSAKSEARGTLVLFNTHMTRAVRDRRAKLWLARAALEADRILPWYQPKVELATGRIIGFEALLRWRTSSGAVRLPKSIAPAFEDHELAPAIGETMLRRTLADARSWLDRGIDFGTIAINAGAVELQDRHFGDRFLQRLEEARVPPRCLKLEVVESVLLGRGAEHVEDTLRQLSKAGIAIALDDFGTGFASLTHLQRFPVDSIKIDRSFVQKIDSVKGSRAIIDAVVGLGRSLDVKVVAEGIETERQAELLRDIGCTFGQGFLYSRPVPARQVPRLLARRNGAATTEPAHGACC